MTDDIGSAWRAPTGRARLALAVGALVCAQDVLLVSRGGAPTARLVPALLAGAVLAVLAGGELKTLGLRLPDAADLRRWLRASLVVAGAMALLVALGAGALLLAGRELPRPALRPGPSWFLHACLYAPLIEELLYRLALVAPLVPRTGRGWAIAVSGAVFAAAHFAGGNAGPDNFFAGYLLAWCYVESRSLLLPIALHAAGNFLVGLFWVALF